MTGYCLEELAFWDKLSDQERDRVRAAAYEADYEPGQMIWSGERDCLGLLLIRSGVVRLFLLSEDGREATISRISGGQVCIMTASCTMSVSSFNVQVQAEGRVEAVVIPAGGRKVIPTGIAIALPSAQYVALVFARSGLGIKHGVAPANCVGVIDSDYRGEIMVGLQNSGESDYTIQPADRIAQLMITPVVQAQVELVDELDDTDRGAGGFGSTGR